MKTTFMTMMMLMANLQYDIIYLIHGWGGRNHANFATENNKN